MSENIKKPFSFIIKGESITTYYIIRRGKCFFIKWGILKYLIPNLFLLFKKIKAEVFFEVKDKHENIILNGKRNSFN